MPIYSAMQIFMNSSPLYGCGVAYDAGGYKTIGTSFEFAGLTDGASPSTKIELAEAMMTFFIGGTVDVEHQMAHAWFGKDNISELWLREGLADWIAAGVTGLSGSSPNSPASKSQ